MTIMTKVDYHFFMPMNPPTITQQEHGVKAVNGRIVFYDTPELLAARQKLTDHLALHKPAEKLQGPLELVATWCFPTNHPARAGTYRTSPPDTDNLDKMLKDCMTRVGYWEDDAQVCREIIEKFWTVPQQSGIYIRIRQL